ncbi:MAG: hypothetical protein WCH86_06020, partial [Kiritimatiellales bacterium]
KVVYPDDLARHYECWDRQLESAFKRVQTVDQPLRELLSEEQWETAGHIAEKRSPMDSILNCLHKPAVAPQV